VPFPSSSKPLPVPEINIQHPAWRDKLPASDKVPASKGCGGQIPQFEGKMPKQYHPPRICEDTGDLQRR
jgi:hypothetical protein